MRRGFLNKPKTSRSDSAPQAEPNQPPAPNIDQTQAFEPVKRVDLFSDGTTHKNESDKNRLALKTSDWRTKLAIFNSSLCPPLFGKSFNKGLDPHNPGAEILQYLNQQGALQRVFLDRGDYPVARLWMLQRPPSESKKRPSLVTQTACMMWPMARKALLSKPGYPAMIDDLGEVKPYEICPSKAGGGFSMFAMRDIERGERIAVDVPFIVMPEDLIHLTASSKLTRTYEANQEWEQAFESMLPEDQKDLLALHDGDKPVTDLQTLLYAIASINQYSIGSLPGGDENALYSCITKDLSRVNHSCAPNAMVRFDLPTFSLELRAMWQIRKSEEITVSYLDPSAHRDRDERRQRLFHIYGFHCQCTLCSSTASQQAQFADLLRKLDNFILANPSGVEEASPKPGLVAEAKMLVTSMEHFKHVHKAAYVRCVDILLMSSISNKRLQDAERWRDVMIQTTSMLEGKDKAALNERKEFGKRMGAAASSLGQ